MHEIRESACGQRGEDWLESGRASSGDEGLEGIHRQSGGRELRIQTLSGFPLQLVRASQSEAGLGFVATLSGQKIHPRLTVAEANDKVFGRKSKGPHEINGEGQRFGIGLGSRVTNDVGVEL